MLYSGTVDGPIKHVSDDVGASKQSYPCIFLSLVVIQQNYLMLVLCCYVDAGKQNYLCFFLLMQQTQILVIAQRNYLMLVLCYYCLPYVQWSAEGSNIALAKKYILIILSSKFEERSRMVLPLKSWIGDSDENCIVKGGHYIDVMYDKWTLYYFQDI